MDQRFNDSLTFFYPEIVSHRWLGVRLAFIGSIITLCASLLAVIGRNQLTGGAAGLSISYSLRISQLLNWLVRSTSEFENNITSIERVKEYFHTPREAEWEIEATKPDDKWPENGNIVFKNYSVRYREELDFALKDINCNIQPGERIGIVGRTGAGKSSLTLALFRLIESNYGEIIIDGVKIREIGLHDLRKKLTIIPQVYLLIYVLFNLIK